MFNNLFKKTNTVEEVEPIADVLRLGSGQQSTPELHDWELVGKTFAAPIRTEGMAALDPSLIEKALFGVTTLIWQCNIHGESRRDELLGSDDSQLNNILIRAENYGIQYVPYNGKKFAVALVPSEEGVPLK